MKSVFFSFCLIFISVASQAQADQTIFQNARVVGGFGGPIFTYGNVKGHSAIGAGGGGGVVINQFMLGAFGHGESISIERPNEPNSSLALGYGGVWLGYSIPSHKAVHGFLSVKVGLGGVGIKNTGDWWDDEDFDTYDTGVLVITPEAGVELNLFHWMRLAGTVGYRHVEGLEGVFDLNPQDFNAPIFGLTLRFGKFGNRTKPQIPAVSQ